MMIFSKYLLQKILSPESHSLFVTRKFFERITYQDVYYDVKELSDWLEIDEVSLKRWIKEIPKGYGYKTFKIRKRKFGYRVINSPNEKLKIIQKKVYHKLLKSINYSPQATAYIKNKSIIDNAAPHVNQEVVINIDLKDFFGHIKPNRVYHSWRSLGWGVEASTILRNICCYNGSLPQGAPTSPAISNLCNIKLDTKLELVAKRCNGNYTRYADDLTFSFPKFDKKHKSIIKTINSVLYSQGYKIQKKKRIRVQRSHQKQTATGLIVNKKVNLPRKTRRKIRAMKHHYDNGTLPNKDYAKLRGYIGLLAMVDKANININNFSKKPCSSLKKTFSTINKKEMKFERKTSKNSKRYLFRPWFNGILGAVVTGGMSFAGIVYWFNSIVSLSVQ